MSEGLLPLVLAGAVLLLVAGLPKVADPRDTVRGMRSAGLPSSPALVRALAAVEVLVGLAVLLGPGRWAALATGLLYAGFTGFVLLALRRGGVVESCGCLGQVDTPPTRGHAAATGLVAAAALILAVAPTEQAWWAAGAGPATVTVLAAALLGFLLWQAVAVLPTATAAAARSARRA